MLNAIELLFVIGNLFLLTFCGDAVRLFTTYVICENSLCFVYKYLNMGLAEPKINKKKKVLLWQAARHTERMLDTSVASAPSLAFGLKMMEKMGWKEGLGLGASNQGITEPVKLKQTIDNKGLGYTRTSGEEQVHYAGHFERFESVLAALKGGSNTSINGVANTSINGDANTFINGDANTCNSVRSNTKVAESVNLEKQNIKKYNSAKNSSNSENNSEDSSDTDSENDLRSETGTSLSARVKNIRGRGHRHKFARGKDVSRYSENDLACILGSKAHSLYNKKKEEEKLQNLSNLVFSHQSMTEYFNTQVKPNAVTEDTGQDFVKPLQLNACQVRLESDDETRPSFDGGAAVGKQENADCSPAFPSFEKSFQERYLNKYSNSFVKADSIGATFNIKDVNDVELDVVNESVDDILVSKSKLKTKKKKKSVSVSKIEVVDENLEKTISKKKRKKIDDATSDSELNIIAEVKSDTTKKKKNRTKLNNIVQVVDFIDLSADEPLKATHKKRKPEATKEACGGVESHNDVLNANSSDTQRKNKKSKKDKMADNDNWKTIEECPHYDLNEDIIEIELDGKPVKKRKTKHFSKNESSNNSENIEVIEEYGKHDVKCIDECLDVLTADPAKKKKKRKKKSVTE